MQWPGMCFLTHDIFPTWMLEKKACLCHTYWHIYHKCTLGNCDCQWFLLDENMWKNRCVHLCYFSPYTWWKVESSVSSNSGMKLGRSNAKGLVQLRFQVDSRIEAQTNPWEILCKDGFEMKEEYLLKMRVVELCCVQWYSKGKALSLAGASPSCTGGLSPWLHLASTTQNGSKGEGEWTLWWGSLQDLVFAPPHYAMRFCENYEKVDFVNKA